MNYFLKVPFKGITILVFLIGLAALNLSSVSKAVASPKTNKLISLSSNIMQYRFTVPGVGEVILKLPRTWQFIASQPEIDRPTTVTMKSDDASGALNFQLTLIPNLNNDSLGEADSLDAVRKMGAQFVKSSIEQRIIVKKMETTIGRAYLANFNKQKYQNSTRVDGEFSSTTIGRVTHRRVIVNMMILSNGVDTKAHDAALTVVRSVALVANNQ